MEILIVDDEPSDLKLAENVLSVGGHRIRKASSVSEATSAVSDYLPDLILLDMKLPGEDGLTLVRKLKADAKTSHIPIVAMTAYPDAFARSTVLKEGCDALIAKPINTRELPKKVDVIYSQRLEKSEKMKN